jgi:16S rRNA (guanine527-N7)-methyltransferase
MTDAVERIASFCEQNDLPWDQRVEERLALYLELLQHFNGTMNLIGPMTEDEVVDQLLIDSLTAAAVAPPEGAIMDVGAGAGLPGIPLACCFPDLPLTLVEPRRKRNTFLKIIKTRLEFDQAELVHERLENTPGGPYNYVIAKAFQPPLEWIETASEWRADDGRIVCMTRPGEREGLVAKGEELGLELVGACDDTTELGAPRLEDARAVYVFG